MAQCSLLELNETRNDSERESFLSKIFFDNLLLRGETLNYRSGVVAKELLKTVF